MISTKEFAGDPKKHGFCSAIHGSLRCILCRKYQRDHTGDPTDDGVEVEVIRIELGRERFKIQIDWSSI